MDDFYRVIAVGGAVLVIAGALWTVVRLRPEHRFSWLGTLMAGVGVCISLVLYNAIVDIELKAGAVWGLLAGGALAGAFLGINIPLYQREGTVLCRAAGWHLALPAVAIAAFQVTGVWESVNGMVLSFAALYAAVGFSVAASALLLLRSLSLRPARAVAVSEGGQCPRCRSSVLPGWRYCKNCGTVLAGTEGQAGA